MVIVRIIYFGQGERNDVHNYLGIMRYSITMHRHKNILRLLSQNSCFHCILFWDVQRCEKCNRMILYKFKYRLHYIDGIIIEIHLLGSKLYGKSSMKCKTICSLYFIHPLVLHFQLFYFSMTFLHCSSQNLTTPYLRIIYQ